MQNIIVKNRQDVVDLAIQYSGNAEAAWSLCLLNNLSITGELHNRQQLLKAGIDNQFVTQYFETKSIEPASVVEQLPIGISIWMVGFDLKVN